MGCNCSKHVSKSVSKRINKRRPKRSTIFRRYFSRLPQSVSSQKNEILSISGHQASENLGISDDADDSSAPRQRLLESDIEFSGLQTSADTNREISDTDDGLSISNDTEAKVIESMTNSKDEPQSGDRHISNLKDEPKSGDRRISNSEDEPKSGERCISNSKDEPKSGDRRISNSEDEPKSEDRHISNSKDELKSEDRHISNSKDEPKYRDQHTCYPADEPKYGDCHIFNYQKFKKAPSLPGSQKDVDRLCHDFKELNFNVYKHQNLTKNDTLDELRKAASKDHTQSKYFVCCFLTYGKDGSLSMCDKDLEVDAILECFSRSACKSLARKPKIFIFPACRPEFGFQHKNPDYLDFLLLYSTHGGKVSPKTGSAEEEGNKPGSFFIDELCRTLEQFSAETDLSQILTLLNYRIAHFSLSTDEMENKSFMPGFTSKLTCEVKFNRKIQHSHGTTYFDRKRVNLPLGAESTNHPQNDRKAYDIREPKRIKFLHLLNTKNFLVNASGLWMSVTARGYQSAALSDWSEEELLCFLDEVASRDFSEFDCLISFILCNGEGEKLCDVNSNKFPRRKIVEKLVGKLRNKFSGKPKIFIFLLPSVKKESWSSCAFPDSKKSSEVLSIPVYSDVLEVTYTIQDSKQVEGVVEKLRSIFGNGSSEDFLSQLTKMNEDLVTEYKFYSSSGSSESATFCINSTLTETLILNRP